MAVNGEKVGIHPTLQDLAYPAESDSKICQFPYVKFGNTEVTPLASNGKEKTMNENPPPTARISSLQKTVEAIKPPTTKPDSYQSLTQATIVLSILCCCWPYNGLLLFLVFYISKMVKYRIEERDFISARSSSCILLACNITALIFGGVVTLAIFITVVYYVISTIRDHITTTDTSSIRPTFNDYNYYGPIY